MSEFGYHHPHELTPAVIQEYIEHLPATIVRHSDDGEIGVTVVIRALATLLRLWNQRHALTRMGILSLEGHPFNGRGASAIATAVATKAQKWIRPLPDEVAIPLLNKAAWFLGTPADDVLRLLELVRDPLAGTIVDVKRGGGISKCRAGTCKSSRNRRARTFLAGFEFTPPSSDSEQWPDPYGLEYERSWKNRGSRVSRARELWEAVRDAAAIVIQSSTGMRVSELLGIQAGVDAVTGLPKGVRLERSLTGLYEWFVIQSVLSKTEEGLPREVDWVLGMRPLGSTEIPIAVRAIYILNQLYEPWYALASTDFLILGSTVGANLPLASARLGPMTNDVMNKRVKRFIESWVDLSHLPDESEHRYEERDLVPWRESKGTILTTHMLRKTWAQFTLACDSRLLPAIQMQFHHLSLAMTEGGYIGRNPLLVEALDSVSVQKRNLMLFESLTGKTPLAGRMGEQLEAAIAKLLDEVGDLSLSQKWQRTVEWANHNDLKMFFSPHATCCPTRTSEMRCHEASETPVWVRIEPNASTREPSVCAGCASAVMDKSHQVFWSNRYIDSQISLRIAKLNRSSSSSFREIEFRADQARAILKKFGADVDELEQHISATMEGQYA